MKRVFFALLLLLVAACASARDVAAAPRSPALRYRLSIPDPASQYAHIEVTVDGIRGKHVDLAMPAWTPGSYLIRDFGRHVHDLQAVDASGRPVRIDQRDKQTWRVHHDGRTAIVRYRVFADELSVRTSHISDQAAHLNGTSLFLYAPSHRDRSVSLRIEPPAGWTVHVALPTTGSADAVVAEAANYDALVDAPMMLGTFDVRTFRVDGTRFEYVVAGAQPAGADVDRLAADAEKIVTAFGELMGGFPMKRFVFLASINREGGGGLEHADSTMMMMRRRAFASPRGYERAARLAAHEFFHLWNVKRLRDVRLRPYNYARENYTDLLWFHEGFTETAESMAMLRSGLTSPEDYVRSLGTRWTRYLRRPGRNARPMADESFDAWTRHYQKAANAANTSVSYYSKGDLIGVALDLEIRRRSDALGRPSDLFAVFRRLMRTHGDKARGITLQDIIEATSKEAGQDMTVFFERYVTGTQELPLPSLMEPFGVNVTQYDPWTKPDGSPLPAAEAAVARTFSGIRWSGVRIDDVVPKSPAARAGLMRGDEVVAVEHQRVDSESDAQRALARRGPGQTATLHLFRDGTLRQIPLQLAQTPYREFRFELVEKPTPDQQRRRQRWLGR